MRAFTGARYMSNVGICSLRLCRSQQQRKIVSLALPAMTQKLRKTSFQDVITVPVNKYDLSGTCGILSSACPVMFSTVADALAEDTTSNVEESEAESVMEHRWPSPVQQLTRKQGKKEQFRRDDSVFVGGYQFNHGEDHLKKLFSQFGKVTGITVPKSDVYNETAPTAETYRFAFIHFKDIGSISKALEAGSILTEDGIAVDIKQRSILSKKDIERKRTFVVKNLSSDFTIEKFLKKFSIAGELEMVNVVFDTLSQKSVEQTFAFLVFKDIPEPESLQSMLESLSDGALVEPLKSGKGKSQPRNRNKKVFVEKLPLEVDMDALVEHFTSFGPVAYSRLFDIRADESCRSAIIEFDSGKEASAAANETFHMLNENSFTVRTLGWSAELI